MKLYKNDVAIPDCGSAIDDEDLVQSQFVREMGFKCPKCEAVYAEIVAYKVFEDRLLVAE